MLKNQKRHLNPMQASIIVPAHNEGQNIVNLVEELTKHLAEIEYEIIIVDDNSTDDTGQIADRLAKTFPNVRVIHRSPPSGFGRAIKDGMRASNGEIIVPVMGDLSDDPSDVLKLIKKAGGGYDVVYGSRFIAGSRVEGYPLTKRFFNRSFNNMVKLLFGIKENDVTNALKAYRREVIDAIGIENIESNDFDITFELPMKAHVLGFSSVEVPVSWNGRIRGSSNMNLGNVGPIYFYRLLQTLFSGVITGINDILNVVLKTRLTTIIASFLIGAFLLFALFNFSGVESVIITLQAISLKWLIASAGIYIISFFFRTWRWSVLLRTVGHKVELGLVFRTLMFGWLLNLFTPARIGDFSRTFALKSCAGVPVSKSMSTVVFERVMDLSVLAIFMSTILYFSFETADLNVVFYPFYLFILLIGSIGLVYIFEKQIGRLISSYVPRFFEVFKGFIGGMGALIKNPFALTLSIVLSMFVWLFEVSTVYFSARAIGIKLSVNASWISGAFAILSQALPTTPAGIGVYEVSMAGALAFYNVTMDYGTTIALLDHVVRVFSIFVIGGISTVHIIFRSRKYFKKLV